MRYMCTAVVIVLAAMGSAAHADASLDAAEAAIRAGWDKLKSFSAGLAVEAHLPLGENRIEVSGTGTVEYLKVDGKSKYRQELTARTPEPLVMEGKADLLFDGAELHLTAQYMGMSITETEKPSLYKGTVPPGGGMLLDLLKAQFELSLKPEAEIDGKKVYVIEAVPKAQPEGFQIHKVTLYVDKEFGFQRKVELCESETMVTATMTLSNPKLNPDLPASRFIYVAPPPPPPKPQPAQTEVKKEPVPAPSGK